MIEGSFATAEVTARRLILEDALAEVLRPIGEISHVNFGDSINERCLLVTVRRCGGTIEEKTYSLWSLACALEAKIE